MKIEVYICVVLAPQTNELCIILTGHTLNKKYKFTINVRFSYRKIPLFMEVNKIKCNEELFFGFFPQIAVEFRQFHCQGLLRHTAEIGFKS